MSLQSYISTHKSFKEIFYYLFDSSEWIHFTDSYDNSPMIQEYKKGLFSKSKKCFVVFVEKDGLKDFADTITFKNMILTRPKPAISFFIKAIEESNLDGILFNNFYFIEKEELKKAHEIYLYDYYKVIMNNLNKIQDSRMRNLQYMRGFFFLPKVYVLGFKENKDSILIMKKNDRNEMAFVFDSKELAEKYILKNKMNNLDVDVVEYSTDGFISNEFVMKAKYIMVNGTHMVPFDEFQKLEKIFKTID